MRGIFLGVILACLASPALASQCPSLWQQLNEKMAGAHAANVDQARLDELRRQGEEYHHAGKHAESEATLKQALALLG